MDEHAAFSERLRQAMKTAGYDVRPVVLEREFNTRYLGRAVTVQAVRRWLRGEAMPSQEKLQVLAEWLQVEPHELRYGAVPLQRRTKKRGNSIGDPLSHLERETLETYLSLPASQRKILREIIYTFAKAHSASLNPTAAR